MQTLHAFVLNAQDVFEYDRRYSLLTQELGKVTAIAKSVRKPSSKLAGHLDVPNFAWVELLPTSKGWQITQALEQQSYPHIRASHDALKAVLARTRFLDAFLQEGAEPNVFALWSDFLKKLDAFVEKNGHDAHADFFGAQFVLRCLSFLGFLPDVTVCNACEKPFDAKGAFIAEHQLVCNACAQTMHARTNNISLAVCDVLQRIVAGTWLPHSQYERQIIACVRYFQQQSARYMV